MKILFIVQARVNSNRLHAKSIIPIFKKKSSLDFIIEKAKKIKLIDSIYIASGPKKKNMKIFNKFKNKKINLFFGYEKNVRKRFEIIQKKENADIIIRATGDNPLIDIDLIKYLLNYIKKKSNISYLKVHNKFVSPGFCVEVFKSIYFLQHLKSNNTNFAKEHVTVHMQNKSGSKILIPPKKFHTPLIRVTLDTITDYKFLRLIFSKKKDPKIKNLKNFLKSYIKNKR